jgi:predicted adenylyl cyclase CyaB
MEIETPVNFAAARAFLKFLGCRVLGEYSKRREIYKLGKTAVTVDFLKKFGWFLEIEGRPRSIKKIEKKLGLRVKDREERSYLQMLFQWKH